MVFSSPVFLFYFSTALPRSLFSFSAKEFRFSDFQLVLLLVGRRGLRPLDDRLELRQFHFRSLDSASFRTRARTILTLASHSIWPAFYLQYLGFFVASWNIVMTAADCHCRTSIFRSASRFSPSTRFRIWSTSIAHLPAVPPVNVLLTSPCSRN